MGNRLVDSSAYWAAGQAGMGTISLHYYVDYTYGLQGALAYDWTFNKKAIGTSAKVDLDLPLDAQTLASLEYNKVNMLGVLKLRNGLWDGQDLLPAGWVERSMKSYHPAYGNPGYGYQWSILPDGLGYQASGVHGQRIYVLPEADMVVVITASVRVDTFRGVDRLAYGFVLPACTDLDWEAEPKSYDAHGFTFEYPAGFFVEDSPIPGTETLSAASGMVQITSQTEPLVVVSVLWQEAEAGQEERALLDAYLAGLVEMAVQLIPGESGRGELNGHPLALRTSQLAVDGEALLAVSGAWICEDRQFAVAYATAAEVTSEALLDAFQRYLAGLSCH